MVLKSMILTVFLTLSVVILHFIVYLHYCPIVCSFLLLLVYLLSLNHWLVMKWRGYLEFFTCGIPLSLACNFSL